MLRLHRVKYFTVGRCGGVCLCGERVQKRVIKHYPPEPFIGKAGAHRRPVGKHYFGCRIGRAPTHGEFLFLSLFLTPCYRTRQFFHCFLIQLAAGRKPYIALYAESQVALFGPHPDRKRDCAQAVHWQSVSAAVGGVDSVRVRVVIYHHDLIDRVCKFRIYCRTIAGCLPGMVAG